MTEQSQLGPSSDGTVMLDIGGEIGALILHTDAELLLAEIEVSRVDGEAPLPPGHPLEHKHPDGEGHAHVHADPSRTHVAVRERRGPAGVRYAAIYPALREGDYTVWGVDGAARDSVSIRGGEVAELDWR
ncbi:MAG: phospholipase [Jatrophihabitans sp.]